MSTTTTVTVNLIQNLSSFGYNIWLYKRPFDPKSTAVQNVLVGVLGVTKTPLQTVGQVVQYYVDNSFCIAASSPLAVGPGRQFGKLSTGVAYGTQIDFDDTLQESKRTLNVVPSNSINIRDEGSISMALAVTTPDGNLVAAQNVPPHFTFMVQPNSYVYLVAEIGGSRSIGDVVSYDVVSDSAYQVDITGRSSVTVTLSANSEGAITWQTLAQTQAYRPEDLQLKERVVSLERRLRNLELRSPVSLADPTLIVALVTAGTVWTVSLVYSYINSQILKSALAKDNIQEVTIDQTSTGVKVSIKFTPTLELAGNPPTPTDIFNTFKNDVLNSAHSYSKEKVDFTVNLGS